MKIINKQSGFSAVELLITLFIAAAFLLSGFQLYALIIKDSGEARSQSKASNTAADYLQQYKSNTTYIKSFCEESTPLTDSSIDVEGLSNTTMTIIISCPYNPTTPSISKITATIKYGNPQKTITNATYVKP